MELSAPEIRVLGCLLEKERTTPQQYPMTESALVTACNQTTNRDPVVAYEQSLIRRTLLDLRQQGLARMVHRPGDRVEKHRHLLDEAWSLLPPEAAVLTVLFLRGAQTVAELRTRTERLHAFSSAAEVEAVLAALAQREPEPFVAQMERQPGQKEVRYRHLLGDEEVAAATVATAGRSGVSAGPRSDVVAQLRAEVAELRQRVERLEGELGMS